MSSDVSGNSVAPPDQREGGAGGSEPGGAGRDAGISAGVATLFLLLRLMAVSDWNWTTAVDVANTVDFGDAVPIVFGTLFAGPTITGILVTLLLPIVALSLAWPLPSRSRWDLGRLVFLAALVASAVTLVSTESEWWLAVGCVVLAALLVWMRLVWRHGRAHQLVSLAMRSVGLMAIVGFLLMAAFMRTPWMSLEQIRTSNGVVVGYVLQTEPGFVKVLTDSDRRVLILRDSDILSRSWATG